MIRASGSVVQAERGRLGSDSPGWIIGWAEYGKAGERHLSRARLASKVTPDVWKYAEKMKWIVVATAHLVVPGPAVSIDHFLHTHFFNAAVGDFVTDVTAEGAVVVAQQVAEGDVDSFMADFQDKTPAGGDPLVLPVRPAPTDFV